MYRQRIGSVLAILVTAAVLALAIKTGADFYADDPVAADTASSSPMPSPTTPTSPAPVVTTPPGGPLKDQLALPDTAAIVVYVGDDSTAGEGAPPEEGYAAQVGRALRWKASIVPGGRGSGYLTSGASSLIRRVDRAKEREDVDLVVVAGSEADAEADPADVAGALPDLLDQIRETYAGASVLVVGPYARTPKEANRGAAIPAQGLAAIDQALSRACSQEGVPYLSPIAGEWLTDDPAPFLTDDDTLDEAGHAEFAQFIEQALG